MAGCTQNGVIGVNAWPARILWYFEEGLKNGILYQFPQDQKESFAVSGLFGVQGALPGLGSHAI